MKFLHEFLKYGDGTKRDNGWWKISADGTNLLNEVGGYHPYIPCPDDIIAEADSWDDLDYSYLLKPDSSYGWIDRDGKFFGCDYSGHRDIAERILHSSERALEMQGWIKIYRDFDGKTTWFIEWDYCHSGGITEAQEKTLEEKGLKNYWHDVLR